MTFEEYKISFSQLAVDSGYSEQNILKCLNYAKKLLDKNLPIIYNESHLSALVGYNVHYIRRAAAFTHSYYRYFKIPKRNGNERSIAEPLPSLKEIQIWILNNILYNIEVSPFAKAYVPNIGIIDNLKFHKKQPKVYTIDLKDFFSSISQDSVEKIFISLNYSAKIARLISKLCTLEEKLPQGTPTSPYLSNIYFKLADESISQYCLKNKIRYTRYADDLTFSGDFDENALFKFVNKIVESFGLSINLDKVKLMMPNERQVVTGIVVNQKLQVVFKKRNILRQEMHYIKKFGIIDHMRSKQITKANYLEHIIGQINFVLHLNPDDKEFLEYKKHLYSIKNQRIQ